MLDKNGFSYQNVSSELEICKVYGKVFQYHRKLQQLPQFLVVVFFDTKIFCLFLMKKSVNFLLIFSKFFSISSHILIEVFSKFLELMTEWNTLFGKLFR